jgi:hypothetical protein
MWLRGVRAEVRAERPDDIAVEWSWSDDRLVWSVANRGDAAVAVHSVGVVARLEDVVEPLRVLRHGYQSWSPTGVATFRVDQDPTRADGVRSLPIGMHHADWERAEDGELRSELVTALRDETGAVVVAGFLGGWEHDGTFAAYQVGWCSWYHYFHAVTEADLRQPGPGGRRGPSTCSSSTTASRPPSATGWPPTRSSPRPRRPRPPSPPRVARPGIWIAPVPGRADSEVAAQHPEWLAHHAVRVTALGW